MAYKDMYYTEEPYSRLCEPCGKTFGKEDAFRVHTCYPQHLISGSEFRCSECDFVAASIQNLRQHFKCKHLSPKFTCLVPQSGGVCGEKFSLKVTVLSHLQTAHFKQKTKKRNNCGLKSHSNHTYGKADSSFKSIGNKVKTSTQSKAVVPVAVKQDQRQWHMGQPVASTSFTNSRSDHCDTRVGWEKLLDVSLQMLLQKMFHCTDCDGYFLTHEDYSEHFAVHADHSVNSEAVQKGDQAATAGFVPVECMPLDAIPSTDPVPGRSVLVRAQTVFLGSMTASCDILITVGSIQLSNLQIRKAAVQRLNFVIVLDDCLFCCCYGTDEFQAEESLFAFVTVTKQIASQMMQASLIPADDVQTYKLLPYDPDGHCSYIAFKIPLTHELRELINSMDRKNVTYWDRAKARSLFNEISEFNETLLQSICTAESCAKDDALEKGTYESGDS